MLCNNIGCGLVKGFHKHLEILCDKTGALAMIKDPKYHRKTKHIKKRYHYIGDAITKEDVVLKHIFTSNLVADPLTKPIVMDIYMLDM